MTDPRKVSPIVSGGEVLGAAKDALSVSALLHWQSVWLDVAEVQLGLAEAARANMLGGNSTARWMQNEFQASLVAIAASAFAVEAEASRTALPDAFTKPTAPGRKLNRGDWIGAALVERGRFAPDEARQLGDVFDLRNEAVHPTHAWDEEIPLHPSGHTYTLAPYTVYSVEAARDAVAVARRAVQAMR